MDIPKNLKGKELVDWLEHASDGQAEETYFRTFDQSELDAARAHHSTLSLNLEDVVDSFADAMKDYRETVKAQKKLISENLRAIRRRGLEEKGRVYIFKDMEALTITTLNKFGLVINTRPMTPEEKQTTIYSLTREANG